VVLDRVPLGLDLIEAHPRNDLEGVVGKRAPPLGHQLVGRTGHVAQTLCRQLVLEYHQGSARKQAEDHKVILEVEKEEAVKQAQSEWDKELETMRTEWAAKSEEDKQAALEKLREDLGDVKQKAARLETSKWQRTVKELEMRMEAEKQAAWRSGMEERDRLASEEAKKLKEAAAKALDEVKGSAKRSLEAAHQDARQAAKKAQKAGMEAGREEARKEFELELQRAQHQHALTLSEHRSEAAEARMRAVEEAREKEMEKATQVREDAERQRAELIREKERSEARVHELETGLRQSEEERRRQGERAKVEAMQAAREAEQHERAELRRLEEELRQQQEDKVRSELAKAMEARKEAIRECEERVAREMGEAMQQLQDESEQLINQLENRLVTLKEEHEAKDQKAKEYQSQIEEQDDTIYDLKTSVTRAAEEQEKLKADTETKLKEMQEENEKRLKMSQEVWQGEVKEANRVAEVRDEAARAQLGEAEGLINTAEKWRSEMHDTLVNHKREALVQHQSQSANIQRQLESLNSERDDLENRKDTMLDEIAEMEVSVKKLENEIRSHSQQSVMSEGRINVAYARKKKRLDEEYEVLLEAVEQKRRSLEALNRQIEECNDKRAEKEDALKVLERQLVEVLVDQQKRLLRILTDAGTEHARYMKAKESTAAT